MNRRIPFGRIVAGVIAAIFCYFGVDSYLSQAKLTHELRVAASTDIVSIPVDLSKPGTHTAKFDCSGDLAHGLAHGQVVYLQITPSDPNTDVAVSLLRGIDATLTITDADGTTISETFHGSPTSNGAPDGLVIEPMASEATSRPAPKVIRLLSIRPLSGSHTLSIDVKKGSVGLRGASQRIFARYQLCSLENLAIHFSQLISVVSFVLAAIIAAVILAITRKRRGTVICTPSSSQTAA